MKPDKLLELDARQALLGGVALLLILVRMIFPGAGVDITSVVLLIFLSVVLYGDALTVLLADLHASRDASEAEHESEVARRVREIAYRVEHARVAFGTEGMDGGERIGDDLEIIVERATGEPRAALLLVWGRLEDRLRNTTGAGDGLEGARRLAERNAVPRQFVEAFDAFRTLRNDVARGGNGDVTEEILWSLVDVGAGLLGMIPGPQQIGQEKMGI